MLLWLIILLALMICSCYVTYLGAKRTDLINTKDNLLMRKKELEYKITKYSEEEDVVRGFLQGELSEVSKEISKIDGELSISNIEWVKNDLEKLWTKISKRDS